LTGNDLRQIILAAAYKSNTGHIGCALSVADIIATLYSDTLNIESPEDPGRDIFILSKGHAALALYSALEIKNWLPIDALNTYCQDGTLLGVHPSNQLRGIEYSTGSLGQGFSVAIGMALAFKKLGPNRKVYVLLSDAECNEGLVWEAAAFAAHHQLDNLIAIVDNNGMQAFGQTRKVLIPGGRLETIWRAFGWEVDTVDGHLMAAMKTVFSFKSRMTPRVIIANTMLGRGVSFMENNLESHYLPLNDQEYSQAMTEVRNAR